jgi:hypothetical protein
MNGRGKRQKRENAEKHRRSGITKDVVKLHVDSSLTTDGFARRNFVSYDQPGLLSNQEVIASFFSEKCE